MTRVISFSNQKGGVGKTTSAINTAMILSEKHEKKVLLIDLDQQANATESMGYYEQVKEENWKSYMNVLKKKDKMKDIIFKVRDNLDLIPSNIDMAVINDEFNNLTARDLIFNMDLEQVKNDYDFVIIDLPPALNVFVTAVFFASDEIYIPITPSPYAMRGLDALLGFVQAVDQYFGAMKNGKTYTACFLTRYKENEIASQKTLEKLKETDLNVFETKIRNSTQVDKGLYNQKTITEFDPTNNTAVDYFSFVDEVLGVINND